MANIPQNTEYQTGGGVEQTTTKSPASAKNLYSSMARIRATKGTPSPSSMFSRPSDFTGLSGDMARDITDSFDPRSIPPLRSPDDVSRFEELPEHYGQFLSPELTEYGQLADIRTIPKKPELAAIPGTPGQYVIARGEEDKIAQTVRPKQEFTDKEKRLFLQGRAPHLFQLDHIIPLWAGGADTAANKQILPNDLHREKTYAQAIPFTLLAAKKISKDEAFGLALSWQDRDLTNLPTPDDNGLADIKDAQKVYERWQRQARGDLTFRENLKGLNEDIPKQLEKVFGTGAIGEFAKAAFAGISPVVTTPLAALLPGVTAKEIAIRYEAPEDASTLETIAGMAGGITGMLAGVVGIGGILGAAGRGISLLGGASRVTTIGRGLAATKIYNSSKNILEARGVIPIAKRGLAATQKVTSRFKLSGSPSALASDNRIWNQLKKETLALTAYGQMTPEGMDNRMERLIDDFVFAGILGAVGYGFKARPKGTGGFISRGYSKLDPKQAETVREKVMQSAKIGGAVLAYHSIKGYGFEGDVDYSSAITDALFTAALHGAIDAPAIRKIFSEVPKGQKGPMKSLGTQYYKKNLNKFTRENVLLKGEARKLDGQIKIDKTKEKLDPRVVQEKEAKLTKLNKKIAAQEAAIKDFSARAERGGFLSEGEAERIAIEEQAKFSQIYIDQGHISANNLISAYAGSERLSYIDAEGKPPKAQNVDDVIALHNEAVAAHHKLIYGEKPYTPGAGNDLAAYQKEQAKISAASRYLYNMSLPKDLQSEALALDLASVVEKNLRSEVAGIPVRPGILDEMFGRAPEHQENLKMKSLEGEDGQQSMGPSLTGSQRATGLANNISNDSPAVRRFMSISEGQYKEDPNLIVSPTLFLARRKDMSPIIRRHEEWAKSDPTTSSKYKANGNTPNPHPESAVQVWGMILDKKTKEIKEWVDLGWVPRDERIEGRKDSINATSRKYKHNEYDPIFNNKSLSDEMDKRNIEFLYANLKRAELSKSDQPWLEYSINDVNWNQSEQHPLNKNTVSRNLEAARGKMPMPANVVIERVPGTSTGKYATIHLFEDASNALINATDEGSRLRAFEDIGITLTNDQAKSLLGKKVTNRELLNVISDADRNGQTSADISFLLEKEVEPFIKSPGFQSFSKETGFYDLFVNGGVTMPRDADLPTINFGGEASKAKKLPEGPGGPGGGVPPTGGPGGPGVLPEAPVAPRQGQLPLGAGTQPAAPLSLGQRVAKRTTTLPPSEGAPKAQAKTISGSNWKEKARLEFLKEKFNKGKLTPEERDEMYALGQNLRAPGFIDEFDNVAEEAIAAVPPKAETPPGARAEVRPAPEVASEVGITPAVASKTQASTGVETKSFKKKVVSAEMVKKDIEDELFDRIRTQVVELPSSKIGGGYLTRSEYARRLANIIQINKPAGEIPTPFGSRKLKPWEAKSVTDIVNQKAFETAIDQVESSLPLDNAVQFLSGMPLEGFGRLKPVVKEIMEAEVVSALGNRDRAALMLQALPEADVRRAAELLDRGAEGGLASMVDNLLKRDTSRAVERMEKGPLTIKEKMAAKKARQEKDVSPFETIRTREKAATEERALEVGTDYLRSVKQRQKSDDPGEQALGLAQGLILKYWSSLKGKKGFSLDVTKKVDLMKLGRALNPDRPPMIKGKPETRPFGELYRTVQSGASRFEEKVGSPFTQPKEELKLKGLQEEERLEVQRKEREKERAETQVSMEATRAARQEGSSKESVPGRVEGGPEEQLVIQDLEEGKGLRPVKDIDAEEAQGLTSGEARGALYPQSLASQFTGEPVSPEGGIADAFSEMYQIMKEFNDNIVQEGGKGTKLNIPDTLRQKVKKEVLKKILGEVKGQ